MKLQPTVQGYGLIEGPVWDPDRGLLFSDVIHGGVFCLDSSNEVTPLFKHRRGIGGMTLYRDEGLIVSGRNISLKRFGQSESTMILDRYPDQGNVGYNDITTDASGRIYAGSLGSSPVFDDGLAPRDGKLHLIDLDGTSRVVAEEIRLTNGLGFSPSGDLLYHSDSRRQQVMVYAVQPNGDLGQKQVFATIETGAPDGLVVAEDGSVWVACAGAGGVAVFDGKGEQQRFIEISVPMCTSVCFGANDLKTLYIVSGSDGAEGDRAGGIYLYETAVSGLPVPAAQVPITD